MRQEIIEKMTSDEAVQNFEAGIGSMISMEDFLREVDAAKKIIPVNVDDIISSVQSGGPLLLNSIKEGKRFYEGTTDAAIVDTIDNGGEIDCTPGAQMFINVRNLTPHQDTYICLSATAKNNLIVRYGVNCPAIGKMPLNDQQTVMEIGRQVSVGKKAQIVFSFGKARGINGAMHSRIAQSAAFTFIMNEFDHAFAGYQFVGGYYSHERTEASWTFPQQSAEILDTYAEICRNHNINMDNAVIKVSFVTSDVGEQAATISARIINDDGLEVYIGDPIKLVHQNEASADEFKELLPQLLAKTKDLVDGLKNLLDIEIKHPLNCFISLAKATQLGKAAINSVLELYDEDRMEEDMTAHDVFYMLQKVLKVMRDDNKISRNTIEKCDENLSRLLTEGFPWEDHDKAIRPEV